MNKLFSLEGLFWVSGLLSIIIFYYIADSKVQTLIDKNNKLGDSLIVLQKNIDTLNELLNGVDTGGLPEARFDTLLVRVDRNLILYRFVPREKNADLYLWSFGDGETSSEKISEHNFNSDKNDIYTVKLEITKKSKKNQYYQTIQLPIKKNGSESNLIKISIRLDSSNFCKSDKARYKFRLKPEGGVVSGKGVIKYKNDFYFLPSGKDVNIGKIFFKYQYNQSSSDYSVSIMDCSNQVAPEIGLPKNEFCVQDSLKYKFIVKPSGSKINGVGVSYEKGEYYFCPSKTKIGNVVFNCDFKGKKIILKVKVVNCPKLKVK